MIKRVSALAVAAFLGTLSGCEQAPRNNDTAVGSTDAGAAMESMQPVEPMHEVARNPLKNAYFGDVHIHTGNSFDAFVFGTRRTPDDAYQFAKGETIPHDGGFDIQLEGPPLDFLAVTDHGAYLGIVPGMADKNNPLSQTETARTAFGNDRAAAVDTFSRIGLSFVQGKPIEEINSQSHMNAVWAQTVEAAERHNEPGVFTAFAGYEFTAMTIVDVESSGAANLHRNVLFRGDAPAQLFTTLDSGNPEDLWRWMEDQRAAGIDSLAIPHNSNASNGGMFAQVSYTGDPLTPELAALRKANEPLVEITQLKGTSDTHPLLSENDEWADFERYDFLIGSTMKSKVDAGSFVRPALARGFGIKGELEENPYEFGFIGSSDTHVAAGTFVEENHWGKFPGDGRPEGRNSIPPDGAQTWGTSLSQEATDPLRGKTASYYSSSGLAGVWAQANTRDDIFDAMRSRETFATSGPRIAVRLFAGDFDESILTAGATIETAYAKGKPMGAVLAASPTAPAFLAMALQDPHSAPLDRLQIIRVWQDENGEREAVYDVACSNGQAPDPETHRCADNGASVDISTCETDPGAGAASLQTVWRDPQPLQGQAVAYYLRALENPTCRWSTWDAVRNGTPPNPELPSSIQERAWSSPIWLY